jgi:uncharacterized repeat protein (TIGR03803 family)
MRHGLQTEADGRQSVLHTFLGKPDGFWPYPQSLVVDSAGDVIGTTSNGGKACHRSGCGTIFKLTPDGSETQIYDFHGRARDGERPNGVISDSAGNLYGTTGLTTEDCLDTGCGSVFELGADGTYSTIYTFHGGADGGLPSSALIRDSNGNFYGTTGYGGDMTCNKSTGCGTVFKVAPDGTEQVIYAFKGGSDGIWPIGNLVLDSGGNLYGTAWKGGSATYGVVFKIGPDGTESLLHTFTGQPDGIVPRGGLIADHQGNLYGTTENGGASNYGTVFEITPGGTEVILHSFAGGADGYQPTSQLTMDSLGNLYGTTSSGGASCCGTIFMISP